VRYSKAPIVEAVIDIQVESDAPPTQEAIEAFAREFKETLPVAHKLSRFNVSVGPDLPGGHVTDHQTQGIKLSSNENNRALVIRPNGFTWSHLPTYTDWETFSGEAYLYWVKYVNAFNPGHVRRIAVRYINAIDVPQDVDLADYVTILPAFPDDLSDVVSGYSVNLNIPRPDVSGSCMAIINTGLEGSQVPGKMKLILDIDVYAAEVLGVAGSEVFDVLSRLRLAKNKIFEIAITDNLREIIA
jgi:uncharacterized protein (TIGR04255 family)